ncbi:hypothetical protein [Synechococcus sp. CC9616]|uniref:hypothetical protein n=1 Tax=Synechococcus sp. CC9616 TaxID=110663 RepID=UPI001E4D0762|nr:hypothetical protein [Synechococcus sp. CC9616]
MNSLLSSNFGSAYLKVGTQFSDYGWPRYDLPEILTLNEVRSKSRDGGILGGHLCSGIESCIGGDWDLWINARDPLKRLSSGIVRFHSKAFDFVGNDLDFTGFQQKAVEKLEVLMAGPLRHEQNGVAKRLAGLAIADSVSFDRESNLETLSCFPLNSEHALLYEVAKSQLQKVKVFIIPDYLHASLICIEKMYDLPPIINLFSDLKHNPVQLGKATASQKKIFEYSLPRLREMCAIDSRLWLDIKARFKSCVSDFQISKKQIAIREAIHENGLLNHKILEKYSSDEEIISAIVRSISILCKGKKELAKDIVFEITRWSRFDPSAATEIRERALTVLGLTA